MAIINAIAEFFVSVFAEGTAHALSKSDETLDQKDTTFNRYSTEHKKVIQFDKAKKFLLTRESDIAQLKRKMAAGFESISQTRITDFKITKMGTWTTIQPPTSISFYSFHFLVRWLTENKIQTIGIIETPGTTYTTYSDPDSDNLIGQTDRQEDFLINLEDDFTKTQFLRISKSIKIRKDFDVATVRRELTHGKREEC